MALPSKLAAMSPAVAISAMALLVTALGFQFSQMSDFRAETRLALEPITSMQADIQKLLTARAVEDARDSESRAAQERRESMSRAAQDRIERDIEGLEIRVRAIETRSTRSSNPDDR